MKTIYFATTNQDKVRIAKTACSKSNFVINPVSLEIDEIQGEDPEVIIRDKAQQAYEQLSMPVVVSDDTWDIPSLNGFPGAYMKSINYWFMPEDFLRLMDGVEDRRIVLRQYLAYTDGSVTEVFRNDIPGQIINEVRGKSDKSPNMTVIILTLTMVKHWLRYLSKVPKRLYLDTKTNQMFGTNLLNGTQISSSENSS